MNKKLFLLALPAFLVLSSCNGLNNKPAQKGVEYFKESLVNEEAFGAAEEIDDLGLKRSTPLKLNTLTSDFVKIGYQIKFNNNNTPDDPGDDLLSVRFVAALKNAGVTAFWKRGLAQPNGYEGAAPDGEHWKFKFSEDAKESKKIYSSLTDGENIITAGVGDYVGYVGFVIYTLTNIPYSSYSDAYLAAYVTLTDLSNPENSIKSKGLALFLEKNPDEARLTNEFCFDPSMTAHFLEGKIGGIMRDGSDDDAHKLICEDKVTVNSGENYASFTGVNLIADYIGDPEDPSDPDVPGDSFGAFYYSPEHFQFFGNDGFFRKSRGFFKVSSDLFQHASPVASGDYNLYIKNKTDESEENFVYAYANSYVEEPTDLYFMPGVWESDNADIVLHCWGPAEATWIRKTEILSDHGVNIYHFVIDPALYNSFIFVRMNPVRGEDSWDYKWNQTGNYENFFHANGPKCGVRVAGWDNYQIIYMGITM